MKISESESGDRIVLSHLPQSLSKSEGEQLTRPTNILAPYIMYQVIFKCQPNMAHGWMENGDFGRILSFLSLPEILIKINVNPTDQK